LVIGLIGDWFNWRLVDLGLLGFICLELR